MTNTIAIGVNIRLAKSDKQYWLNQMQQFANRMNADKVKAVEFGKQDIRGTESITLVDNRNCVPMQKHFGSKKEMLAFIEGYNMAHEGHYDRFSQFSAIDTKHRIKA